MARQVGAGRKPRIGTADAAYVRRAIDLAYAAVEGGNRPFAAILVGADGQVLAEGSNVVVASGDPFNHAEMNVLRIAHLRHGPQRIKGATLYVNGEPCTMCAGTIIRYGLGRVLFGLREKELRPYVWQNSLPFSYPSAAIFKLARPRIRVLGGLSPRHSKRPFELYVTKGQF